MSLRGVKSCHSDNWLWGGGVIYDLCCKLVHIMCMHKFTCVVNGNSSHPTCLVVVELTKIITYLFFYTYFYTGTYSNTISLFLMYEVTP